MLSETSRQYRKQMAERGDTASLRILEADDVERFIEDRCEEGGDAKLRDILREYRQWGKGLPLSAYRLSKYLAGRKLTLFYAPDPLGHLEAWLEKLPRVGKVRKGKLLKAYRESGGKLSNRAFGDAMKQLGFRDDVSRKYYLELSL